MRFLFPGVRKKRSPLANVRRLLRSVRMQTHVGVPLKTRCSRQEMRIKEQDKSPHSISDSLFVRLLHPSHRSLTPTSNYTPGKRQGLCLAGVLDPVYDTPGFSEVAWLALTFQTICTVPTSTKRPRLP